MLCYDILRFVLRLLIRVFYRLRIINKKAVPLSGGALIVANHLSFIDALFIIASTPRRVRIVTSRDIYNIRWLRPFCRMGGAFPLSPKDPLKEISRTLGLVREAIRNGELVCMFPEGGLSRTGNTLRFSRGMEHIMRGMDTPIIPAYLDRTWNSIWGFGGGKYFFKRPRSFPHPVTIMFGDALPSSTSAFDVRQKVLEIGSQAFRYRLEDKMTLPEMFFIEAKKDPFNACIADSSGKSLNRCQTFVVAYALTRKLRPLIKGQKFVGCFLPPSVGGVLSNLALGILGKVVVNLNYTAPLAARASAAEQCSMSQCITSRAFLEKLQTTLPCEAIYIEDLVKELSPFDKQKAMALLFLMPHFLAHRLIFRSWRYLNNDELVTVVFTSGSTGNPKGVMLTHSNITANLEGVHQAFQIRRGDTLMGILPHFHSFGFTATLWLPLASKSAAVYHTSPMDAQIIGEMVRKHRATLIMATPTFISAYTKRCDPGDFKTIRFSIIGAEKMKPAVARAFKEKFGIALLEGYGCSELSPVVSLNFPDYEGLDMFQKAQKPGTIGCPLPGVAVRVVNPETFETLPPGQEGLLLVKGQNVMRGYLHQPERTRDAFHEGWYKTGDIAFLDNDGFITITDRLSRFSKIAGEMVPHIRVEEAIHEALESSEAVGVVSSVPDDRKGERLVVLYVKDFDIPGLLEKLKASGLPNLWIPARDMFFKVEAIPVLGSGKLDLTGIKRLAESLAEK
ncbi:MAG: AMP-binding protein [Candidatus Omnitrophica bacterium]|nr:AMP-binding protein [Candidatus Omnitrophota bacterium]